MPAAVLERVRQQLREQRVAGAPFEEAWPEVLDAAVDPTERPVWLEALEQTAACWRAAYERRPATAAERALAAAGLDPEREPDPQPDPWDRICGYCGGPIPPTARPHARYCSHRCRRAVHGRRAA